MNLVCQIIADKISKTKKTMNDYFRGVLRMIHNQGIEITPAELQMWLSERFTVCSQDTVLTTIVKNDGILRSEMLNYFAGKAIQS